MNILDVDAFKETIWGSIKSNIGAFGVAAKGKFSASAFDSVALDLSCDAPTSTKLFTEASAGKDGASLSKVKAVQTADVAGGALVVSPTYHVGSNKGDLSVAFALDGSSSVQVDVNTDKAAKLSLTQRVGDRNVVRPSITNDGQLEVSVDTAVEPIGTITTTYKPNHHVNIKWADGPWQANFQIPMEGYYNMQDGVKISVKTKVDVKPGDFF